MGIPRSGTTLVCRLLNGLPNVVALVEPLDMVSAGPSDAAGMVEHISAFMEEMRHSILDRARAVSHHRGGNFPDGMFEQVSATGEVRRGNTDRGEIEIKKRVNESFLLVLKHPAPFTALLHRLHPRYQCFATIRNPLAILASWNSIAAPVRNGHAPAAERFDPRLSNALALLDSRIDRQLRLLSWHFEQYRQHLPGSSVLRYEEVTASSGRCLSVIAPAAAALRQPLENRDCALASSGGNAIVKIARRLLASDGAYWSFYSKQSIQSLLRNDGSSGESVGN
jgi:hypothetical protein